MFFWGRTVMGWFSGCVHTLGSDHMNEKGRCAGLNGEAVMQGKTPLHEGEIMRLGMRG